MKKALQIIPAEIPLLMLLLPKNKIGSAAAAVVFLLLFLFLLRKQKTASVSVSAEYTAAALALSTLSGIFFYLRWQNTSRMKTLSSLSGLPPRHICALITVLLCLAACFSLLYLRRFFSFSLPSSKKEILFDLLFVFLLAALTITLTSRCSRFYPFNDWVDPQTMFTLGKGMLRGSVPYRDLYEQKGPFLLALHALAAVISFDSLDGVWLIEITACFFTLWFLYKMLKGFLGRKALAALPLLALLIYVSRAFVAGDSAEEMSLPFLTYGLYCGICALRENRLPNGRESFLVGITSGCVLWIKFSHVGFYAGWFLFYAAEALRGKKAADLVRMLGRIVCGVVTAALPVFLYFGLNRAVRIFLECYFLNNIRYYPAFSAATGPFRHLINLWHGFQRFLEANPVLLVFTAAGLAWCFIRSRKRAGTFMLLTLLSGFIVMFVSGVSFPYYVFIFSSFSVFGVMWLYEIPVFRKAGLPVMEILSFFLCTAGCLLLSPNIFLLKFNTADFPQFAVMEAIENSGIEDPDILHYGLLDAGFNLPTGLVPKQRFFCSFNLRLPEMAEAQDRYIEEAVTDFVITCHEPLYETDNYQLIGTWPGDFAPEGTASLFFLYQKADTLTP